MSGILACASCPSIFEIPLLQTTNYGWPGEEDLTTSTTQLLCEKKTCFPKTRLQPPSFIQGASPFGLYRSRNGHGRWTREATHSNRGEVSRNTHSVQPLLKQSTVTFLICRGPPPPFGGRDGFLFRFRPEGRQTGRTGDTQRRRFGNPNHV